MTKQPEAFLIDKILTKRRLCVGEEVLHNNTGTATEGGFSTQDVYLNLYLLIRPDHIDPAIDFVEVKRGVFGGLLLQRRFACGCHS